MFFPSFAGFSGFFSGAFVLVFLLVLGIIFFVLVRGVAQWSKNNHSPVLTVAAEVVAKRTHIDHHMHTSGDHAPHFSHSTRYFATFQVQSGDRLEFLLDGRDFGQLCEGDYGMLTFQGTRYLSFTRQKATPGQ